MAGYLLLGTLAAFGLLSALWTALGWMLPGAKGCALVCYGMPDEGILARAGWLAGMGLLNCPLLVVSEEACLCPGAEICGREELLSRLERERNGFDGTGNGNHPGRHQRGGVSKL